MFFAREGMYKLDCLSRPVSFESETECLWSDKCDYWIANDCENLNPHNYNLVILQWNIRSLMRNLNELKLLLTKLENINLPVDVLLLCETFLTKITSKTIKVLNYTIYHTNRIDHKGGEMAILVRDGKTHKRRKDLEIMVEKEVEAMYVEITARNRKHIVVGMHI